MERELIFAGDSGSAHGMESAVENMQKLQSKKLSNDTHKLTLEMIKIKLNW